jgi:hypothetical protein
MGAFVSQFDPAIASSGGNINMLWLDEPPMSE